MIMFSLITVRCSSIFSRDEIKTRKRKPLTKEAFWYDFEFKDASTQYRSFDDLHILLEQEDPPSNWSPFKTRNPSAWLELPKHSKPARYLPKVQIQITEAGFRIYQHFLSSGHDLNTSNDLRNPPWNLYIPSSFTCTVTICLHFVGYSVILELKVCFYDGVLSSRIVDEYGTGRIRNTRGIIWNSSRTPEHIRSDI